MKLLAIYQQLLKERRAVISTSDLRTLLQIPLNNTLYHLVQRLVRQGILKRLGKGFFAVAGTSLQEFTIANALYPPSYISLESALHFYGILLQTPRFITSVTPRRPRRFVIEGKEFTYAHIAPRLFQGFLRRGNFLIAEPEKALLDECYLIRKGKRRLDLEDLHLTQKQRRQMRRWASRLSLSLEGALVSKHRGLSL